MKTKNKIAFALITIMALAFTACGEADSAGDASPGYEPSTEKVLTVTGDNGESKYSEADLMDLGFETVTYSGRNKEGDNKRQIKEYTGTDLNVLLEHAGYDSAKTITITCSDGYTRDYDMDTLNSLYAFESEEDGAPSEPVIPMLVFAHDGDKIGNDEKYSAEAGSPVRLIFGQEDFDASDSKDFNMQGWASYVQSIKVTD